MSFSLCLRYGFFAIAFMINTSGAGEVLMYFDVESGAYQNGVLEQLEDADFAIFTNHLSEQKIVTHWSTQVWDGGHRCRTMIYTMKFAEFELPFHAFQQLPPVQSCGSDTSKPEASSH